MELDVRAVSDILAIARTATDPRNKEAGAVLGYNWNVFRDYIDIKMGSQNLARDARHHLEKAGLWCAQPYLEKPILRVWRGSRSRVFHTITTC